MAFVTVTPDQQMPTVGEFEVLRDGKCYAVVLHPRKDGWLAICPPANSRVSGLKSYATRAAAVRHVIKALS
jgi:hypothetical protein